MFGNNDCRQNISIPWLLLMLPLKEICPNSLVYNCAFVSHIKASLLYMFKIEWLLLNESFFPCSVLVKWGKNRYYITGIAISQCQKYRSTSLNARSFPKLKTNTCLVHRFHWLRWAKTNGYRHQGTERTNMMAWWMTATTAQVWKEFVSIFVAVGKTTISRSNYTLRDIFANDYVGGQRFV